MPRNEGNGSPSSLDAVRLQNQFLVFYTSGFLYLTKSEDGRSWDQASTLVGVHTWLGPAQIRSVSVAARGDAGQLLWIDERFQHSDRTPRNPLGLPWLLTADWANNDVLALPLSILEQPLRAPIERKPARLTRDLSFAAALRVRAGKTPIYAIWPGRVRVGKQPGSFGKPPTIFFQSLPPE
jgi:hypothetical protein